MKKTGKKSMTVKGKLTMFAVIVEAILIVISVAGVLVTTLVNRTRSNMYYAYGDGSTYIVNANNSFNRVRVQMRNALYVYLDDKDTTATYENYKSERESAIANVSTYMAEMKEYLADFDQYQDQYSNEITTEYNECLDGVETFETALDEVMELISNLEVDQAREEMLNVCNPASEVVNESIQQLVDLMDAESDAQDETIGMEVSIMIVVIVVVCLFGAVMTLVYSMNLIRGITNPVAQLSAAARKLGTGDINIELHKLADDDLGRLMDDFDEMAATIRAQSEVAVSVADGDMTVDVVPRSEEDVLGRALHKLVKDNDHILSNVRESTMQVTVGADEVAAASQALAQGATEQASALQEVTASMNEIAQHTKQNAEQANEANERVINVKDMAASGNNQMKSLIGAMNDINEASETIAKIIKTIDDISFQTNILALNAAVEAARAGVHGKGFAVVAEEVRNLAAKSASAASETAEMIEDAIHKINNGTQLAESTAQSLDEIVESIDKIVELIGAIASASNEQATSVTQVDQAIDQVSQVVQTNSATSQECAASSAELSSQAANLRSLVAHYKLTTSGGHDGKSEHDGGTHFGGEGKNEQIISLDGEFGKY